MQINLQTLQQKRNEKFQNSLFVAQPQIQQSKNDIQVLSNENYIQMYIKCTITPDQVANKEPREAKDIEDDDVEVILDDVIGIQNNNNKKKIENEELGMKKEFNVFVERGLVPQIKLLQQNYIEKQDLIKMPVCGSSGIRLPEEADFMLYFEFFKIKDKPTDYTVLAQNQDTKLLFGLLICGCIFQDDLAQELAFKFLTKKLTVESLIKLLLITVQYESSKYSMYIYKLVKQLMYYKNGILKEANDPLLKDVISQMRSSQVIIEPPNIIIIVTKQFNLRINTTFLYPLYKRMERERGEFLKPLQEYSQFHVTRNGEIHDDVDMEEFPHIYYIKKEQNQQLYLVGIQYEAHAEMLIFSSLCDKYSKYNEHYVGSIERNIWGTSFNIYDDGYPEEMERLFPEWIGLKRRKIMKIEYETNIMASQPRHFDIAYLNIETKKFEELVTLKPKYNPQRDCYQLNFNGYIILQKQQNRRAKIPSARNFQMIKQGDEQTVFLLHGKMDKNLFNLDFRPPLSILQAFSVSLVSISSKALVS